NSMSKETAKLLEQLASKLGTTTEYLWGILLKQAFISACIGVFYLTVALIGAYGIYRWWKHLDVKVIKWDDPKDYWAPFYIVLAMWCVFFAFAFTGLHDSFYGFFNPEYWALEKILSS